MTAPRRRMPPAWEIDNALRVVQQIIDSTLEDLGNFEATLAGLKRRPACRHDLPSIRGRLRAARLEVAALLHDPGNPQ